MDGPLLILAGAGTGKTRVITCRAAHLLRRGVPPEALLMVTFTNKAAGEMQERIAALTGREQARRITAGTFHRFGLMILRRHIARLGYSPRFGIAPESYQAGLVKSIMGELGATGEGYDPDRFQARISLAKNALQTADDLRASAVTPVDRALADVYEAYRRQLKMMDLVDFDDLLILVLELWDKYPQVLEELRERHRYLMVDEYQDTNQVQFQLVARLAGPARNLAVVGDDDQSIYGWRGATVDNILRFEDHFPNAKIIRLEQNYRSTGTILEAANAVIACNPKRHGKRLWSGLDRGEPIISLRVPDDEAEAATVADLLHEYHRDQERPWTDFAILYRSNHQSRAFEEKLRQAQIPYVLVGSKSFFERKEILDGLSLIQAAANPKDDLALLRVLNVPPRGVGEKTVERLRELQQRTHRPFQGLLHEPDFLGELSPATAAALRKFGACLVRARESFQKPDNLAAKIRALFDESGYLEGLGRMYKPREDALNRQENLMEFLNAAAEFEKAEGPGADIGAFLDRFTLMDMNDRREESDHDTRGVTLMTVHAAKGLEYPAVFVVGLENNLFPNPHAVEDGNLDEERRLFYVAVTRARQFLVLVHAEKRRVRGDLQRRRVSPFLEEIPAELLAIHTPESVFRQVTPEERAAMLAELLAKLKE